MIPKGRALLAAGAALTLAAVLIPGTALAGPIAVMPPTLPLAADGVWSTCATAESTFCIAEAVAVDGQTSTTLQELGLQAWVKSLDPGYEGGPSGFNWAISATEFGWLVPYSDLATATSQIKDSTYRMTIRTGEWMPRYDTAMVAGMTQTLSYDVVTGWSVTIEGTPMRMDWAAGDSPIFGTCGALVSCGDETTQANALGTGLKFNGFISDLAGAGWSDADRTRMAGMWISSDAQGGPYTSPLALQFINNPDAPGWSVQLGNPHLDIDGNPVRGSLQAWMPAAYFTAAGTTAEAAAAIGFTITSDESGVPTEIGGSATVVDGGVLISVPDLGYSIDTITVTNVPPTPPGPSVPDLVEGEITATTAGFTFAADPQATYTYEVRAGETSVSTGTATGGAIDVTVLTPNTEYTITLSMTGNQTLTGNPLAFTTFPAKPGMATSGQTETSLKFSYLDDPSVTEYLATAVVNEEALPEEQFVVTRGTVGNPGGTVDVTGLEPGTLVTVTLTAIGLAANVDSDPLSIMTLPATPVLTAGTPKSTTSTTTVRWTYPTAAGAAYTNTVLIGGVAAPVGSVRVTQSVGLNTVVVTVGSTGSPAPREVKATVTARASSGQIFAESTSVQATQWSLPLTPMLTPVPASLSQSLAVWSLSGASCGSGIVMSARYGSTAVASNQLSCVQGRITVSGLPASTSTILTVKALGHASPGQDVTSDASSQKTLDIPPPDAPMVRLLSSETTTSKLVFSFIKNSGVTYTAVAKVGTKVLTTGVALNQAAGTVTITGLSPKTTVSVVVTATKSGKSTPSSAVTGTTKIGVPGAPTGLSIAVVARKFTVTWKAPIDTGGEIPTFTATLKDPKGKVIASRVGITTLTWVPVVAIPKGNGYTVTVVAVNSAGTSQSAIKMFSAA